MTWISFLFAQNWAGREVPEFIAFALPHTSKDCMIRSLICSNLTTSIYNLQAKLEWLQRNPHFSRNERLKLQSSPKLALSSTNIGACTLPSFFLCSLCEVFLCPCLEGLGCAWWPVQNTGNGTKQTLCPRALLHVRHHFGFVTDNLLNSLDTDCKTLWAQAARICY